MPSFFLMTRRPPKSTLFPYTPLFRSARRRRSSIPARSRCWARIRPWPWRPAVQDRKSTRLNSSHRYISYALFFFNDPAPTEIYTLSLHAALPICAAQAFINSCTFAVLGKDTPMALAPCSARSEEHTSELQSPLHLVCPLFF